MRKIQHTQTNDYYVNSNFLHFTLAGNVNINRRAKDRYDCAVSKLIHKGIIDLKESIPPNEYIVTIDNIYFDTANASKTKDYFCIVSSKDIETIMNYKHNINNPLLLRYYIYLVSTFVRAITLSNNKINTPPVGFQAIERISSILRMSKKTIYKYNSILEELKLICVYRQDDCIYVQGDNKLTGISNTYGRYCDREKIKKISEMYRDSYNERAQIKTCIPKEVANNNRRLSALYRNYVNGVKIYSESELREIYIGLKDWNEKQVENKRKDLTVFKDFEFYRKEDV